MDDAPKLRKAPREVELKRTAPPPGLRIPAPIALDDVLGQDRAIAILRAAIDSKRLHHAWIFHGPPGVGKLTTALAFAAILLDPSSEPDLAGRVAPDPDSSAQALLRAGTHPDLHLVTKELAAVSRDPQIRDSKQRTIAKAVLEEFLIEPSTRTGSAIGARAHKVFLIDEAELIDARGQNALLKTLEEPAPGRVIILMTSREEHLLSTIRSRAQRVAFAPLDDAAMKAWLKRSDLDVSGLSKPTLEWLTRFAEGSPGMLSLAISTGIVRWHDTLAPMLAVLGASGEAGRSRFPLELAGVMSKLADEWAQGWVDANDGASKDAANKAAARHMLHLLADHVRHALRAAAEATPEALELASDRIDAIADAERIIDANVPVAFAFENLIARLAGSASAR